VGHVGHVCVGLGPGAALLGQAVAGRRAAHVSQGAEANGARACCVWSNVGHVGHVCVGLGPGAALLGQAVAGRRAAHVSQGAEANGARACCVWCDVGPGSSASGCGRGPKGRQQPLAGQCCPKQGSARGLLVPSLPSL